MARSRWWSSRGRQSTGSALREPRPPNGPPAQVGKRSKAQRRTRSQAPAAFINLPYAKRYEKVYLAFIAGVAGYGLIPTAAVRDPSSHYQLERIYGLISEAQYSFH